MAEAPYLSLFSGAGGLDLAVRIASPNARCVGDVEIDVPAAGILAARMAEGSLDDAPIWSDIRTFPVELYRGRVAGIVGGFPCTDLSVAGRQAGITGEHSGLWFEYLRLIREIRPSWVFIENVPPVLAFPAGGTVLGGLAGLGFDAEWTTLPASAVGASHRRNRVFILAHREGRGLRELWEPSGGRGLADGGNGPVVHPELPEWGAVGVGGDGRSKRADGDRKTDSGAGITDGTLADSASSGLQKPEQPRERKLSAQSRQRMDYRPQRSDGDVVNGDVGDTDQPGLQRRGLLDRGCAGERAAGAAGGDVADCPIAGLPISDRKRAHATGKCDAELERGSGSVADSGCQRHERWGKPGILAGPRRSPEVEEEEREWGWDAAGNSGSGVPIFAPGPGDPNWTALLVRFPWLRPAVAQAEVESHLCGVADELADLVGSARTDALRACGNGVVALQGATAFISLARRAGIKYTELAG